MQTINVEQWQDILTKIRDKISESAYLLWFKNTTLQEINEQSIVIGVSNRFIKGWVKSNYQGLLEECAGQVFGKKIKVEFRIVNSMWKKVEGSRKNVLNSVSRENQNRFKLNPNYVFENFATGPDNNLAYMIVQELSRSADIIYNPLLIYGDHGVGKTHLLQSFCHSVMQDHPNKKIAVESCPSFMHQYVSSIQNNQYDSFKARYHDIDVLVLDDIHYLCEGKKSKTQEECLHLIESLINMNKQVIISSRIHPNRMDSMKPKLRDILKSGLVAQIHAPGHETRHNIILNKCSRMKTSIPKEIIDYLVHHTNSNVREIEGILMRISAFASLEKSNVNMNIVREALGDPNSERTTDAVSRTERVLQIIADHFNMEPADFREHRRGEKAIPRQICMFILRDEMGVSYQDIGRDLNCKSHGSVIYAERKIKRKLSKDKSLQKCLQCIRDKMRSEFN